MTTDVLEKRSIETFTHKKVDIPDNLRILQDGESIGEGECVFRILGKEGDRRIVWNSSSIPEINDACSLFKNLIKEGMVPYRVGVGGRTSADVMTEFDPHAGEVIFMPMKAIRGG